MAKKDQITIRLHKEVPMTFIRIPKGEFLMGLDADNISNDEKPQHSVYLDEYWIGQTPVTNRQYSVFLSRKYTKYNPMEGFQKEKQANYPRIDVDWYAASEFCEWLAKKSGLAIRLPTEAEWEKAARGTDGREFPWGNQEPDSNLVCMQRKRMPVGNYPQGASPYGVLDLSGPVTEWTSDWYDEDYYKHSPERNPTGPAGIDQQFGGMFDNQRVFRGGININRLGSAIYRGHANPGYDLPNCGFRCVCAPNLRMHLKYFV